MSTENTITETSTEAPIAFRCDTDECTHYAVAFVKGQNNYGEVWTAHCTDHISEGDVFCMGFVSGLGVLQRSNAVQTKRSFSMDQRAVLMAVQLTMPSAIETVLNNNNKRIQAIHALDAFKEQVTNTVVNWDGGCRAGKEEFLEELGLEWPKVSVTVTVSFEYSGDPEDLSSYDCEAAIEGWVGSENTSGVYVEIDY